MVYLKFTKTVDLMCSTTHKIVNYVRWWICSSTSVHGDFNIQIFTLYTFSSVQSLSHVRLFVTPWISACQASLSITNSQSSPKLMCIKLVMPPSHLILCRPFSSCPQPLAASGYFPMSQLFAWGGQSTQVSALHDSFQRNPRCDLLLNGLVGSPWSPRDSQKSSPTPQFKSINSLVFSFLYSPTFPSIQDYWKNQSLD